jgi:hypothetical protein
MLTRRHAILCTAALPGLLAGGPALAKASPVFAEDGIAIRGADAVAYFRGMGAVAGTVRERVRWHGAFWLFSTRENREAFERDPRRFAPRFGGYCAYTLSQGRLAASDPRAYTLHEDRLYLLNSVTDRKVWMEHLKRNIRWAEAHWPQIVR